MAVLAFEQQPTHRIQASIPIQCFWTSKTIPTVLDDNLAVPLHPTITRDGTLTCFDTLRMCIMPPCMYLGCLTSSNMLVSRRPRGCGVRTPSVSFGGLHISSAVHWQWSCAFSCFHDLHSHQSMFNLDFSRCLSAFFTSKRTTYRRAMTHHVQVFNCILSWHTCNLLRSWLGRFAIRLSLLDSAYVTYGTSSVHFAHVSRGIAERSATGVDRATE